MWIENINSQHFFYTEWMNEWMTCVNAERRSCLEAVMLNEIYSGHTLGSMYMFNDSLGCRISLMTYELPLLRVLIQRSCRSTDARSQSFMSFLKKSWNNSRYLNHDNNNVCKWLTESAHLDVDIWLHRHISSHTHLHTHTPGTPKLGNNMGGNLFKILRNLDYKFICFI